MTTNETKRNAAIVATTETLKEGYMRLRLTFANGEVLEIDSSSLSNDLQEQAMIHGLKQKLVDAAAISRNPETGRAASIDDKYQAVRTVYDRLLAGQWNATREGGASSGGLLLQALARMYAGKKTPEQLREYLAGKSDAEKAALRKNPKVAAIIDDIRAEQGKTANIDTDELLEELEG